MTRQQRTSSAWRISLALTVAVLVSCADLRFSAIPAPDLQAHVQQNVDGTDIPFFHESKRNEVMLGGSADVPGSNNLCATQTWLEIELQRSRLPFQSVPTQSTSPLGCAVMNSRCQLTFRPILFGNLQAAADYKWQARPVTRFFWADCEGSGGGPITCVCEREQGRLTGIWSQHGPIVGVSRSFRTPGTPWDPVTSAPFQTQNIVGTVINGDVKSLADDDEQFLTIRSVGNPRVTSLEAVMPVLVGKPVRAETFSARVRSTIDCPTSFSIQHAITKVWEPMRTFNAPTTEAHIQNILPNSGLGAYLQNFAGLPAGSAGALVRLECNRSGPGTHELSVDQIRLQYERER